MAVARQGQTLILPEKIKKSGREVGLGWGCKVDGHMPWGALSGFRRVRGHKRVLGGRGGGFHAPVVQYLQQLARAFETRSMSHQLELMSAV
jgi:hypothetical protein